MKWLPWIALSIVTMQTGLELVAVAQSMREPDRNETLVWFAVKTVCLCYVLASMPSMMR